MLNKSAAFIKIKAGDPWPWGSLFRHFLLQADNSVLVLQLCYLGVTRGFQWRQDISTHTSGPCLGSHHWETYLQKCHATNAELYVERKWLQRRSAVLRCNKKRKHCKKKYFFQESNFFFQAMSWFSNLVRFASTLKHFDGLRPTTR